MVAVRVDQPGALGHRHQGADVVEQVDEQEDEDDLDQGDAETALQVRARAGMSSLNAVADMPPRL